MVAYGARGDRPRRRGTTDRYQQTFQAPVSAGDQEWICTKSGLYTVYAWGPGGKGQNVVNAFSGGAGALAIATRVSIRPGTVVGISIPAVGSSTGHTVATIPGRSTLLVGGRGGGGDSLGPGGVASGGDININGAAGTSGGTSTPDAPSYDGFMGGRGGVNARAPTVPGGPGGATDTALLNLGAPGLVIICRDK